MMHEYMQELAERINEMEIWNEAGTLSAFAEGDELILVADPDDISGEYEFARLNDQYLECGDAMIAFPYELSHGLLSIIDKSEDDEDDDQPTEEYENLNTAIENIFAEIQWYVNEYTEPDDPLFSLVREFTYSVVGDEAEQSGVKECPICDSEDVEIRITDDGEYYVYCNSCMACGPTADSENLAIAYWNRRQHG